MNDETSPDFAQTNDDAGLIRESAVTATTMVARMNTQAPPFTDQRVRNAVQLAVDNAVVLELGVAGLGSVAENHHVAPVHPEYAELPKIAPDPRQGAGADDRSRAGGYRTGTDLARRGMACDDLGCDRGPTARRGLQGQADDPAGIDLLGRVDEVPVLDDVVGRTAAGVQVYALAYRSGEAWNESAHSNPEFDAKLEQALGIFDPDARRPLMAELEKMLQDSGVIIQPYWNELIMHRVPAVQGYQRHPLREMHLEAVWLDR